VFAVDFLLAIETVGRLGAGLQPCVADRLLTSAAQAVLATVGQGQGLIDLPQAEIVTVPIGYRHPLLLDRVHAGQPADRLVEIDDLRALLGRLEQPPEFGLESLQSLAPIFDLFLGKVAHDAEVYAGGSKLPSRFG